MELINLLKTNNIKKEMEIIKKNRFKEDYEGIIILNYKILIEWKC